MVGRSKVWRLSHFADSDRMEVQCNLCPTKIKFVGNTTNIARHLELKHPIEFAALSSSDSALVQANYQASRIEEENRRRDHENTAIRRILQRHNNELRILKEKQYCKSQTRNNRRNFDYSENEQIVKMTKFPSNDVEQFNQKQSLWSWHTPSNDGEDRKMDLSSLVAGNMNENSMGSVGDNPGTSNDCPIPSPEQYLTEEMDQQPTPSNIQVQRPESYKLRHNNHLSLVLESLAGDESFMDVTLTAQGKAIKAHKSVLSAVSPYFKSVLKENPCQHPIIIMPRDIRFGELNNIISYVYKGEMTVAAEDLPSLLRTAEILQVTGLTPSDSSAMSGTSSSILGQIRGATAAAAANSNMSTSCSSPSPSPAKTVNKKSARYHSTPKLKEVPQSSSYDNEMPDKIDPLDYLNPDMACVKEELSSDDEKNYEASTETAEDVQFPTQIPQDLPVDSSYNSKKGCPLSKKRKASTETSSLHDDPDEDAGNHSDSLTDECLINQTALFVCPYCFESHRPTEVLQTHLRLKHPSKPSFLCKCGKVFVRQALFEQHKKSCDKL